MAVIYKLIRSGLSSAYEGMCSWYRNELRVSYHIVHVLFTTIMHLSCEVQKIKWNDWSWDELIPEWTSSWHHIAPTNSPLCLWTRTFLHTSHHRRNARAEFRQDPWRLSRLVQFEHTKRHINCSCCKFLSQTYCRISGNVGYFRVKRAIQ